MRFWCCRRLEAEGAAARPLGQALFDHFCSDMDANLREMGVGDMAVPRKMKAIAEAFYGRKRAYEAALAAPAGTGLTSWRRRWRAMSMPEPSADRCGRAAARGLYARGGAHACRHRWRGAAARRSSRFPIRARLRPPNRQVRHEPRKRTEPRQARTSRDDGSPRASKSAAKSAVRANRHGARRSRIHEVPETGRHVDAGGRRDHARRGGGGGRRCALCRASKRASTSRRHGRDGLHVVGRVSATVGQTCVVTLEPIENEVEEAVDLVFAPAAAVETARRGAPVSGRSRVAADDAPEPLVGGVVDLGVIATEFLTLGIDPYPRKSGVEFAAPAADDDTPNPFAALAALKKEQGGS